MKKLLIATMLVASFALEAATWTVTTTCGVIGTLNISDNATTTQVAAAVSQYNYNVCGVRPKTVTLTL